MSTRFKLYDKKGEWFNIEINIEPNNKGKLYLSVTGFNNWCGGQCYDSIIPKNKYQEAFIAFWKRWHLNDMNPDCEHQKKLWDNTKKIEVHEYTSLPILYGRQNKIEKLIKEKLISTGKCEVGTLIQTALSLMNKTFNDLTILTIPEYFRKQFKVNKTEIKTAGWVNPEEHEEGLLCKPCPVCGYKYGTDWLYEELPTQIEKAIFFFKEKLEECYL